MATHILAIDQGTTSTRAIVFDAALAPVAVSQREFTQIFPTPGEVEHDPEEIWSSVLATVHEATAKAGVSAADIAAIGITNQRETTVVWDRATGQAVHRAIVWQDRRTADFCARLKAEGHEPVISAKAVRLSVSKGRPKRASTASGPSCRHKTPSAARQSGSSRISRCVQRPRWYVRKPDSEVARGPAVARRFWLAEYQSSSAASSSLPSSDLIFTRCGEDEMSAIPFGARLQLLLHRSTAD